MLRNQDIARRCAAVCLLVLWGMVSPALAGEAAAGATWEAIGPFGGEQVAVFMSRRGTLLCSHPAGGVYRSENQGQSWSMIRAAKGDAFGLTDVGFFTMAEAAEGLYAGGPAGLWFSADDGKTWERIRLNHAALDSGGAAIVSIVPIGARHLVLGCASARGEDGAELDGIFQARLDKEWNVEEHKLRGSRKKDKGPAVVRVAYDDNFAGEPVLFAASYRSGLSVCRSTTQRRWSWKSVRLPDIKGSLAALCVDPAQDVVYLGTSACEILRGVSGDKDLEWSVLEPLQVAGAQEKEEAEPTPLVVALMPDPVSPARIWWGTDVDGAGVYPVSVAKTYYGWAEWRNGRWTGFWAYPGPGLGMASDAKAASPPDKDGQRHVARLYVAQTGAGTILGTGDGGKTWKPLCNGISGVKVNRVSCFEVDKQAAVAVAGSTSNDLSWDAGRTWDSQYSFRSESSAAGVTWGVHGIARRYQAGSLTKADLLAVRGLPCSVPGGEGLYVVWTAGGSPPVEASGRSAVRARRLYEQPAAGMYDDPLNDRYVFLPLQVGGAVAFDLKDQRVVLLDKGLPGEGSRAAGDMTNSQVSGTYAMCFSRNQDWTAAFVSAVDARVTQDGLYALQGRGGLYRVLPLYDGWQVRADAEWQRIDPPARDEDEKARMFVALACRGTQLVALSAAGELYAAEDAFAREVIWRTHTLRLAGNAGAGGEDDPFTGMAVRWDTGSVFVSTLRAGVSSLPLKDVFGERAELTARAFGRGLGTMRTRSLALSVDGQWLYVGTERMGVWRCRAGGSPAR